MQKINSFDKINLIISGMRSVEEYELICEGDRTTVSLYNIFYCSDNDRRRLAKSVSCDTGDILRLLNECKIPKWDGFSGKNPIGVRDGYMFRFEAELGDGRTIRADGSNNYPKGYREFLSAVSQMLRERESND
jgi:hypothetical protein